MNHCCKCGSDRFTTLWWSPIERYVAMVECDSCSYRWRWKARWPANRRTVRPHLLQSDDMDPGEVETLRLVAEHKSGWEGHMISARELALLLGVTVRSADARLQRLFWSHYLAVRRTGSWPDNPLVYRLTQLGREALEGDS